MTAKLPWPSGSARWALAASIATAVIAVVALLRWVLGRGDYMAKLAGGLAMAPGAAAAFLITSAGVWVLARHAGEDAMSPRVDRTVQLCGVTAALLGGIGHAR
jgi:hypothetical protein